MGIYRWLCRTLRREPPPPNPPPGPGPPPDPPPDPLSLSVVLLALVNREREAEGCDRLGLSVPLVHAARGVAGTPGGPIAGVADRLARAVSRAGYGAARVAVLRAATHPNWGGCAAADAAAAWAADPRCRAALLDGFRHAGCAMSERGGGMTVWVVVLAAPAGSRLDIPVDPPAGEGDAERSDVLPFLRVTRGGG